MVGTFKFIIVVNGISSNGLNEKLSKELKNLHRIPVFAENNNDSIEIFNILGKEFPRIQFDLYPSKFCANRFRTINNSWLRTSILNRKPILVLSLESVERVVKLVYKYGIESDVIPEDVGDNLIFSISRDAKITYL